MIFRVLIENVLAQPQQFDHHRIALGDELDHAARRESGEPRQHLSERYVARNRDVMNQRKRENAVGLRARLETPSLSLTPALIRRGIGDVQEQRLKSNALRLRAIERQVERALVEVESDRRARTGL